MVRRPSTSDLAMPESSSARRNAWAASESGVSSGSLPCLVAPTPTIEARRQLMLFPLEHGLAFFAECQPAFIAVLGGRQRVEQPPLEIEVLRGVGACGDAQGALGGDHRERCIAGDGARKRDRRLHELVGLA